MAKRTVTRLGLICCGQTTWEAENRLQGDADLPLSEAGRESVLANLTRLKLLKSSVICHPHDEAAAETARLCAQQIRAETREVEELADPALGLLQGLTAQEFSERFPSRYKQWMEDPITLVPPEGETIAEGAARVFVAIGNLLRRSRATEVSIVLHPVALGLVRCALASRPLGEFRALIVNRPFVERYAVAPSLLDEFAQAGSSPAAGQG